MIDWITVPCMPCTHSSAIKAGMVIALTIDGEVEWQTNKRLAVEGSFSSTVQIRSSSQGIPGTCIEVSGNPSKFLQGHNLFGSNDLTGLVSGMMRAIFAKIPQLTPSQTDLDMIDRGSYLLSRVDIAEVWALANRRQVRTAISTLAACTNLTHRPGKASITGETTCYWGKNSRRWALKAYCKGDEIEKKGHRLPPELMDISGLEQYADTALRIELVLRGMELKDTQMELHLAANWGDNTAQEVYDSYLSRLKISEATMMKTEVLIELPPRLQLAYQSWLAGHDLRAMMPTRTFYRYRKEFMEHGIDISNVHHTRKESNVIPLGLVLHARPVGVPNWAIGTPLYFEPRSRAA